MMPLPKLELTAAGLKLILGIACALALALLIHDRNRWKAKTIHYAQMLAAERGAHAGTVANFRAAAEQARRADLASAERVRKRQSAINERTEHDYEKRLADARAAAGRLRVARSSASAHSRGGRASPMPGLPAAPGGAVEAARQDRLSESERLIATEQAIQLDELIRWVERQAEVEMSGR